MVASDFPQKSKFWQGKTNSYQASVCIARSLWWVIAELNSRTSIGLAHAGPGVYSVFELEKGAP